MEVGDVVYLESDKGHVKQLAIIVALYDDIKDGVRLDRELDGFRSWNMADLVLVGKGIKKEE